jgi:prepilin-type processing-associated H-X9-DG protein
LQWCMGTMEFAPGWTNTILIQDSLLYKYVNALEVYRCPADKSSVKGTTMNPYKAIGPARVRSMSMNAWMNPLPGQQWALNGPAVKNFRQMSHITKPSETWVTIDENPRSINDGWFVCNPPDSAWVDIPATYHNKAGGLAYADGHAEIKRWRDNGILKPTATIGAAPEDKGNDLKWLQRQSTYP